MVTKRIDAAILAHRGWVSRFKTALEGINTEYFDLSSTLDWSRCDLGYWLAHDDSRQTLGPEIHQEIDAFHVRFHEICGVLATQLNQRQVNDSVYEVVAELDRVSKAIVRLLSAAKEKASVKTPF